MRSLIAIGVIVGAAGVAAIVLPWSDPTTCTVARVLDGDTWDCEDGRRIRLRGVDAPETMARNAECPEEVVSGERAASIVTLRLLDRTVTLVDPDPDEDPFGRVIADVVLDHRDVGAWLLREGHAVPWPHEPGAWCP